MKRKKIRIYLVDALISKNSFVDIFGKSLEEIEKIMAVENEEMVSITNPSGSLYTWRRKYVHDWQELEE